MSSLSSLKANAQNLPNLESLKPYVKKCELCELNLTDCKSALQKSFDESKQEKTIWQEPGTIVLIGIVSFIVGMGVGSLSK